MMDVGVYRLPMAGPDDVSELEALIDRGEIKPEEICAIIAQTEGDGYARGYSALAFQLMLSEKLGISRAEVWDRIPMLMIGLTGGLMSPHYTVFTRKEVAGPAPGEKRLAIGIKDTRVLCRKSMGPWSAGSSPGSKGGHGGCRSLGRRCTLCGSKVPGPDAKRIADAEAGAKG